MWGYAIILLLITDMELVDGDGDTGQCPVANKERQGVRCAAYDRTIRGDWLPDSVEPWVMVPNTGLPRQNADRMQSRARGHSTMTTYGNPLTKGNMAMTDINTDGFVAWRESTRKRAATYNKPYAGFTRESYGIPRADIPEVSLWEMVDRSYQHMLNNEVISKVGRVEQKAKDEGTPFDAFKFVHDERMAMRQRVLDGALGRRSAPVVLEVDEFTRECQIIAHNRAMTAAVANGRDDFPSEFNTTTAKYVIGKKTGTTLGQLVANLIELNKPDKKTGLTITEQANENIAKRKTDDVDDDAAAFFEDDDESEDEDEAAA